MKNFGTVSAVALASALAACSYPGSDATKGASIFGGKVDYGNIGLATRAQAALVSGDVATGIQLAEKAVENSPTDAGFRTLLGNAYFAAGRFNSADASYRDSLRLVPVQPQVALKRALVLIAQGRNEAAMMMLNGAQDMISPADRGLAMALAGRPDDAVRLLDDAARQPGADGRVRQNLALAHALKGDWQTARVIASQDVPAYQLDARMQEWMVMAKADHPAMKVASITGIRPAASDAGMPVRLALAEDQGNRLAQIQQPDVGAPVAMPSQAPVVAAAAPVAPAPAPAPIPRYDAGPSGPELADVSLVGGYEPDYAIPVADVELTEIENDSDDLAPIPAAAPKPSAMAPVAFAQVAASEVKSEKPAFSATATRLTESARSIRAAANRSATASRSVVQVAAYLDRASLTRGWSKAVASHAELKGYAPMAARTVKDGQTFYRLAAHGFADDAEARDFCMALKASGTQCFVRRMAGDAPFRLASRD